MSRQHQKGLSLISLLVGLFISMLCILAGLTLYRSTLRLSTDAKIDAQIDGQITSVLLTLQHEIQNAGFGMTDDTVVNVTRADHSYTTDGGLPYTAPALVWRYMDGGNVICRGVKEVVNDSGEIPYRELALVTADGCVADSDLTGLDWEDDDDTHTTIIGRWPLFDNLKAYITVNDNLFNLGAPSPASCSPYGAMAPQPHLQVTVSAPSSASLNEAGGARPHSTTICLLNTPG